MKKKVGFDRFFPLVFIDTKPYWQGVTLGGRRTPTPNQSRSVLKGSIGWAFGIVAMPVVFAYLCWRDNSWPWEVRS